MGNVKVVSAVGLLRRADSQGLGPQGRYFRMRGCKGPCRPGTIWGDVSLYVEGSIKARAWSSQRPEFESWLCLSLCVWPGVSHLTSSSFNFCIFSLNKIVTSTSQDSCTVGINRHSDCNVLSTGLTHRST